jgi:hypothetical protein
MTPDVRDRPSASASAGVIACMLWNREAQSLTPTRLGEDQGVQPDELTVHVHEGTSAVARVDRRVRLNIDGRTVGIRCRATEVTTPIVTELRSPSGLPNANTSSPCRIAS